MKQVAHILIDFYNALLYLSMKIKEILSMVDAPAFNCL